MDNKPSDSAIAKAFWEISHKDGWDSSPNALSLKCAVIERAKEIDVTEQPHGASEGSDAEELEFLEHWLRYAAEPVAQECCGRGYNDCCGDPDPVFATLTDMTDAMNKRRTELVVAIDGPAPEIDDDPRVGGGYPSAADRAALATPSQPSCVQDARDGCEPYFVEVDQNGCASCGHDRMWTVVGPDGVAASKSWGDEEEAEWFCECMNEAFAVGQANPPAAITAKPGKGETK